MARIHVPHLTTIAVVFVAAIALTGCASEAGADGASRSPSSSAVSPSSSPAPTAAAGITAQGIGDVKIGGSFASAATELGVKPDAQCPATIGSKSVSMTWVTAKTDGTTVSDTINLVAIDSLGLDAHPAGTPLTAEGIGLGSSRADLQSAYPTAQSIDAPNMDFGLRVVDGGGSIVFSGRDGIVQSIQVLPAADQVPVEYCG